MAEEGQDSPRGATGLRGLSLEMEIRSVPFIPAPGLFPRPIKKGSGLIPARATTVGLPVLPGICLYSLGTGIGRAGCWDSGCEYWFCWPLGSKKPKSLGFSAELPAAAVGRGSRRVVARAGEKLVLRQGSRVGARPAARSSCPWGWRCVISPELPPLGLRLDPDLGPAASGFTDAGRGGCAAGAEIRREALVFRGASAPRC